MPNQFQKNSSKDGFGVQGEITMLVRDQYGNVKQQWNENKLGKMLRKMFAFMAIVFSSQVGIFNHFAEQGVRLFGLGHYGDTAVIRNLVTNAGFAGMASRCNGAGAEAAFTYLGVGIGTTAAAAGNTTLESEIVDSGLARAAATCTRVTTTETNDTAQLDKTFTVTGTKAVTECGALNAGSGGVLLGRQVFSAINVVNGDTLQITYKFKFS